MRIARLTVVTDISCLISLQPGESPLHVQEYYPDFHADLEEWALAELEPVGTVIVPQPGDGVRVLQPDETGALVEWTEERYVENAVNGDLLLSMLYADIVQDSKIVMAEFFEGEDDW